MHILAVISVCTVGLGELGVERPRFISSNLRCLHPAIFHAMTFDTRIWKISRGTLTRRMDW